ncbi:hypothetical protein [Xanthomonas sp. LMG 12460]|uniref:hypothetical protein n=1 Tax=Xanthomonas sp. LMG 12460 TaxID=1591132 RepID=UPI0003171CBB|nr:hypothetical protein [Xanthomonas sp. LMG 12460]KAB7778464.1 hypothetical protein CEK66_08890 [Xanthomonas sp. LMG 12460]
MKKKLLVATALLAGSVVGAPALAAENPVDQAGIQHNMYLGCLMDLNATAEDALTLLVKKCGYAPGVPLERFVATQQPIVDAVDPTRPMTENLAGLRQQLSAYEYSFIERMDQIVQNAEDLDAAAVQFEELEREAIARLDPKSQNGALILGGLSVARHSTQYWSKYAAEQGESPAGATAKKGFWKWLATIGSDVVGYLASHNIGTAATVSNVVHGWFK